MTTPLIVIGMFMIFIIIGEILEIIKNKKS